MNYNFLFRNTFINFVLRNGTKEEIWRRNREHEFQVSEVKKENIKNIREQKIEDMGKEMIAVLLRFAVYLTVFGALMLVPDWIAAPVVLTIFICKLDEIKKRL